MDLGVFLIPTKARNVGTKESVWWPNELDNPLLNKQFVKTKEKRSMQPSSSNKKPGDRVEMRFKDKANTILYEYRGDRPEIGTHAINSTLNDKT